MTQIYKSLRLPDSVVAAKFVDVLHVAVEVSSSVFQDNHKKLQFIPLETIVYSSIPAYLLCFF
jgi:hypothetical protein